MYPLKPAASRGLPRSRCALLSEKVAVGMAVRIRELMSAPVTTVTPETTLERAAVLEDEEPMDSNEAGGHAFDLRRRRTHFSSSTATKTSVETERTTASSAAPRASVSKIGWRMGL